MGTQSDTATAAKPIAQLAYNAGFRGQDLITAVAVALAESGGNLKAINDNPNTQDYSIGPWQINYFGKNFAPRAARYGTPNDLLANPQLGANAAFNLYQSAIAGNRAPFGDWSTWLNGSFRQYLAPAAVAVGSLGTNPTNTAPEVPVTTGTDTTGSGSGAGTTTTTTTTSGGGGGGSGSGPTLSVSDSWKRILIEIGLVILALVLLVIGFQLLVAHEGLKPGQVAVPAGGAGASGGAAAGGSEAGLAEAAAV